ncbi:DUF4129 domain-containing protein [Paenibacillus sp. TRM 82003]|nr:DUF4129 domain-containing protein [Paenibacillus sp. TRM 82003]
MMGNDRSRWSRHLVAAYIELLLLLPVWLGLDAYFASDGYPFGGWGRYVWILSLPLFSAVGVAAGLRWNALWQRLAASALIGAAGAYVLADASYWLSTLAAFAIVFAVTLLGASIGSRWIDPKWYWAGLALYFVAAIAYPRIESLSAAVPWMTGAGIVCLALALFATNGRLLRDASLAKEHAAAVPTALRRHNGLYMGGILIVVLTLTALFGNAFGNALLTALRWLLRLLFSSEPVEEPEQLPPPPPPTNQGLPQLPEGERGWFGLLLDIVGYTVAGAVILAVVGYGAYWLYKHSGGLVRTWLSRLAALLRRGGRDEEATAYTDEETTVFSWETVGRRLRDSWLGRFASRARGERWEEQRSNAERVRYLYRRRLRTASESGYEPRPHLTPKETEADIAAWAAKGVGRSGDAARFGAADTLLGLYYRVRYGASDVPDAEVERLRGELDGTAGKK